MPTFLSALAENLKNATSLQAVLAAVGVAVISGASSAYSKSKIAGIGMAFLGLVLIVAPFELPAPQLFGPRTPETMSGGGWHIYDYNGFASNLLVTMDESGLIQGTLVTTSCPVHFKPQCEPSKFPINGKYKKGTGTLTLTRTNPDSHDDPMTTYYATFDSPYFAHGSIRESNGDTSIFVLYNSN